MSGIVKILFKGVHFFIWIHFNWKFKWFHWKIRPFEWINGTTLKMLILDGSCWIMRILERWTWTQLEKFLQKKKAHEWRKAAHSTIIKNSKKASRLDLKMETIQKTKYLYYILKDFQRFEIRVKDSYPRIESVIMPVYWKISLNHNNFFLYISLRLVILSEYLRSPIYHFIGSMQFAFKMHLMDNG